MKLHTKIILNIIAISLMATGPILMVLPGPQVLSWLGLALFIYINKDWLKKYRWFRLLEHKLRLHKINKKYRQRYNSITRGYKHDH